MNPPANPQQRLVVAALITAILLPPLLTLCLVAQYGVNVPFADDFTLAPLFAAAHDGTLKAGSFIAQHNEHRMVLLRVFALGFAYLAHGNLRAEMIFSVAIVVGTALLLWRLVRRTINLPVQKQITIMVLLSLLLFSPVQAENWTWGFQFALFLNNLLVVSAISIATSGRTLVVKFVLCALFGAVATYSFGNGAVIWLLSFPLALITSNRQRTTQTVRWATAWSMLAAAAVASYFVHYRRPAAHPALGASRHVTDYLTYVFTFLGAHLSRPAPGDPLFGPMLIGAGLLVIATVATGYIVRHECDRQLQARALPWIALAAYAFISAVLAAVSRVGFGVPQALESRYTSFSLYLSIGIVGLFGLLLTKNTSRRWQTARMAFVVAVLALSLGAYSAGIGAMDQSKRSRLEGRAALLVANILHSDATYEAQLCANAHDAKALANVLNGLGLMQPRMMTTARLNELKLIPAGPRAIGYVDEIHCSDTRCVVRGWAFLTTERRIADAILLSCGTGDVATLFEFATERHQRLDLPQVLGDPALLAAGWTADFERNAMPPGAGVIRAWAMDSETATLYELHDSVSVP